MFAAAPPPALSDYGIAPGHSGCSNAHLWICVKPLWSKDGLLIEHENGR